MSPVISLQRRFMELGRVRLGEKGPKGEPRKRSTFRFTTASESLATALAEHYGGKVAPWEDAPAGEGYWQVSTETAELDIILPPVFAAADGTPTTAYSQWYELWAAGGCQRRCDGETEALTGKPCLCAPQVQEKGEEERECQITTRVSFLLPDIPGLGVWRLDSKGWNAAVELPGTLELLVRAAAEQTFIPAKLRIEQRTKKVPGQGTRRYVVPVIDLPSVTIGQLVSGDVPSVLNAPRPMPPKPELPAGPDPIAAPFDPESAPFGQQPALPGEAEELGELTEAEILTVEVHSLAEKGKADLTLVDKSIETNRVEHLDEPDKHVAWLKRQRTTLSKRLEQDKEEPLFKVPEKARQ